MYISKPSVPVSRLIGACFTLYDLVAYNNVRPYHFLDKEPHQRHLFFDNPRLNCGYELLPVAGAFLNELVHN